MTTLTCPKCRQGVPDAALDAGQCHLCGFALEGPVLLAQPGTRGSGTRWLLAGLAAVLVVGAGIAYALFGRSDASHPSPTPDLASLGTTEPARPVRSVAPFPHEPKARETGTTHHTPADPGAGDKGPPQVPVVAEVQPKGGPRPIGVAMRVDPKITPQRHFDHPDDTAWVTNLNPDDRVTLTGRVRVLRLGSVRGKGVLDASGLIAEEVEVTGDLEGESLVLLNAPNGRVTIGGFVIGTAKLTVVAPGGRVTFASTGRVAGAAAVIATAKRLEMNGPMSGGAKVNVTLTASGSLKFARAEDGATITYKKAGADDPAPTVEKGELRDGAKIHKEKP